MNETPKLDWYLKWFSSAIVLIAMSMRGIPELYMYDLVFSTVGITGWLGVQLAKFS